MRWLKIGVGLGALLLTSCFGLFDNGSDRIVDTYEVTWIDSQAHRALYEGNEEVVPAYIAAVGFDSTYLFVKQHPLAGEHDEKVLQSITNYYLIVRAQGVVSNKKNSGPFSEAQFNSLCKKRGVKKVEFSTHYPENI